MPTLLAGPLGAIFEHGIQRKMKRAAAKAKALEAGTAPKHKFHEAEVPTVPPPKSKTLPGMPTTPVSAPHMASSSNKAVSVQPAATKPPAPHIAPAKTTEKKPNAA
jgi:hypothetical protein